MSRTQQDQVIDDDEVETCPLCIEEFDLSDREFRPCPCGYQICQFCYNNIKTTMNGLCPACRRPYDDKNIQWRRISPEEMALHRENIAQQAKRKAAARQKEAQRREADSLSRKHLAGIRVRQKNLVYVTGMRPNVADDQLAEILRTHQYFGQYGQIIKIVVSKAKDSAHPNQGVGVYVTFARMDDAQRCIQAVDGSQNYGNKIRAQYGTTKYCSAYLRNELCNNKSCMFLHEPGEENESFTRQDLSSMNVISTQSPAQASTSSSTSFQVPQPQPPPQQAPQSIAAASQPMDRQDSKDRSDSPVDSSDGSALPSTVNWAAKSFSSRRPSQSTSAAALSPLVVESLPALQANEGPRIEPAKSSPTITTTTATEVASVAAKEEVIVEPSVAPEVSTALSPLTSILKHFQSGDFRYVFDETIISQRDLELIKNYPPLFDPYGGIKRSIRKDREAREMERLRLEHEAAQASAHTHDIEEVAEGGSLQLGGEPEEQRSSQGGDSLSHVIRPSSRNTVSSQHYGVDRTYSPANPPHATQGARSLSEQQRQHILLQQLKSASPSSNGNHPQQMQPGMYASGMQIGGGVNNARQTSRFSFSNETSRAPSSVKPNTNSKIMTQQSAMMPSSNAGQYGQHSTSTPFFTSGVQGPPPGLKATGTPPVSGGGMFGQGHGFTTAGLSYGVNPANRAGNEDVMRELFRNRGGSAGSGQASDTGRLDHTDPSILQARMHQVSTPAGQGVYSSQSQNQGGYNSMMYGNETSSSSSLSKHLQDNPFIGLPSGRMAEMNVAHLVESRRPTPVLPPGLKLPFGRAHSPWLGQDSGNDVRVEDDALAFPGLGVIPANTIELSSPVKALSAAPEIITRAVQSQSEMLLKEHDTEKEIQSVVKEPHEVLTSLSDVDSFPALPKVRPVVTQVKERKPGTTSRTKDFKEAARLAAKEATMEPAIVESVPNKQAIVPSASLTTSEDQSTDTDSKAPPSKRQHPGKLDITAATETMKLEASISMPQFIAAASSKPGTPLMRARESSVPPSPSSTSRPSTPAAVETPIKRTTQPRTIRLIATPKAEIPPVVTPSVPVLGNIAQPRPSPIARLPSRRPSIASTTIPGTPVSEKISDNASMTTESISRAGSPLQSKVGSAPVRIKTKSQQKKDRQERAKLVEESQLSQDGSPGVEDVMQGPILGRKKKTKKATMVGTTAASTPGSTRPASPIAAPAKLKEPQVVEESPLDSPSNPPPASPPPPPPPRLVAKITTKLVDPLKTIESKPPVIPEVEKKAANLPTSVIAELHASGDLMASALEFFKTVPGLNFRAEITAADLANAAPQPPLSPEELAHLDVGRPVRRGGADGRVASRVLITPSRKYLRGLASDLEDRYLDLERFILTSRPPLKYTPRQDPLSRSAEDMLKEMAAALIRPPPTTTSSASGPSAHTSTAADNSAMNANAAKVAAYADDALAYLNQFILPPLPARSKNGEPAAPPPIGSAIPRTYTTGDPTYSVSGVDVPTAANAPPLHNVANPAAAVNAYSNIAANAASAAAAAAAAAGLNINAANATATLNKADALLQSLGVDLLTGPAMKAALANVSANVTPAQGAAFASLAKSVGILENVAAAGLAQGQQGQQGWNQVVNAMAGMGINLGTFAGALGLGTEDAEAAMVASRRECEGLEKKMAGLVKRNRRIVTGAGGVH